jgi:NAD(P)-dependent dehydrogenase (short-subunit alcohol dehydrogenase family)
MDSRLAMVVGATSGIGRGIAMHFAQIGFSVVAVGRSRERGEELVQSMQAARAGGHSFQSCDASSIKNIFRFCSEFSQTHSALDVLVMTQGIASMQGFTPTEEGLDLKIATHYYGRVAFALSLMPLLKNSQLEGGARVLSVLGAGIHPPYTNYKDDPLLRDHYTLNNAANAACMYNDIAADSLARENPNITFFHAAPGFINTNWGTELPLPLRLLVRVVQPFGRTPEDCANVLVSAILSPPPHTIDHQAKNWYLLDEKGRETITSEMHEHSRERFWQHTIQTLDRLRE